MRNVVKYYREELMPGRTDEGKLSDDVQADATHEMEETALSGSGEESEVRTSDVEDGSLKPRTDGEHDAEAAQALMNESEQEEAELNEERVTYRDQLFSEEHKFHAEHNPLYDLKYQTTDHTIDFSPLDYREWKANQDEMKLENSMRLEIYRDSQQILDMVNKCVKQEDRDYLRTRLETS